MPVWNGQPGEAPGPGPEAPKIYSEHYKHSIVDSVYQNENSILSMVTGRPRLVYYYRQILKDGEEPHTYQPGSGVYQQYSLIKNLIIKQTDESFNFDGATATSNKPGSAYVIFGLAPILGDVFIADIGDGNAGLFTITEQPRINEFTANKVYLITFIMQTIVTQEISDELNSFVADPNILYYSRDQHLNGGTPLLTQGDFDLRKQVESWYPTIVHNIYETFFWEEERTISLLNGEKHYYDPYLTKAFLGLAGDDARATYPKVYTFSLEYGGNKAAQHGTFNIWDVLMRGDFNLLRKCNNKAAFIDVRNMYSTRLYENIRASAFDGFLSTDPENYRDMSTWISWRDNIINDNPVPNIPILYMFSDEFYKGNPQTEFEKMVVDVFKNNLIDLKRLNNYLETYWDLPTTDQLYHGVILIAMIKKARKMGRVI